MVTHARKPLLVLTPGDPEGIGPELVWDTLRSGFAKRDAHILCVGARAPFDRIGAPVVEVTDSELARFASGKMPTHGKRACVPLLVAPKKCANGLFLPGFQSGWSIERAVRLVQAGVADALVTGPIHKEHFQAGGYSYPGHTEFLAKLCGVREVTMMLANDLLRVSLVTTHIALEDVPHSLTRTRLRRAILHTSEHLKNWWKIRSPRIAVAALNPHAGEGGLFGNQESKIIRPEIKALSRRGIQLFGPLPADTLFAKHFAADVSERFDAVICMYHDQGLIPVKLLDFARTVNVTLGLPIIRTSVDHGVAFDLVGTGRADPSSLQSAITLAIRLAKNRRHQSGGT